MNFNYRNAATRLTVAVLLVGPFAAARVEAKPKRWTQDPVLQLAYAVEDSAQEVYLLASRSCQPHRSAYHGGHGPSRVEAGLLHRLDRFSDRAAGFRQSLGVFGPYSREVRDDYVRMMRSFESAQDALFEFRGQRKLDLAFRRSEQLIHDLRHAYEIRIASGERRHIGRDAPCGDGHCDSGYVRIGRSNGRSYADLRYTWDDDSSD